MTSVAEWKLSLGDGMQMGLIPHVPFQVILRKDLGKYVSKINYFSLLKNNCMYPEFSIGIIQVWLL